MSIFWCDVRTNGKDEHTHIIYIQLFSYDAASLCRSDGNHPHSSCKFSSYWGFPSCYYILSVWVMYATRLYFIMLCSFHPTFMCLFLPITYTYLITDALTLRLTDLLTLTAWVLGSCYIQWFRQALQDPLLSLPYQRARGRRFLQGNTHGELVWYGMVCSC